MTTSDGTILGTTQIYGSALRNRAFNVVMLGDGFTAAQQGDLDAACGDFLTAFLATKPYDRLAPAINVFRVNVSSTDSGAADPVGQADPGRLRTPISIHPSATTASGGCSNTTARRRSQRPPPKSPSSRWHW